MLPPAVNDPLGDRTDIRNFADAMADVAAHGRVVVLGSEQAIDAANAERPGLLSVSRVI